MRVFIVIAIFAGACFGRFLLPESLVMAAEEQSLRPNVVLILADDLGIGDASCYNPQSRIPMPALNAIADEGMRFTDMHTPSSVCSPTRYALLTGRYAWRSRLKNGVLWGYSRSLIRPDRPTLGTLLQKHGYATACVGKWHLGFQAANLDAKDLPKASAVLPKDHPHAVDYAQPLRPGPVTVGFDYFFGIPASLDMEPYVFVENDRPVTPPTALVKRSQHRRQSGGGFWRAGPIAPDFKHVDVLPKITEAATGWIERQSADKPFFLYFPLSAPHTPWLPTPAFRNKSQVGYYGDFVMQVDHTIAAVVKTLKEQGLEKNTLLIVTSDNGSHWPDGDITKWQHDANAGLRGQKADIHEGGHRVPFVVRWPGVVAAKTVSHHTGCLTDVYATLADMLGHSLQTDEAEDSFSLLPVFKRNGESTGDRPPVIHHSVSGMFAIRQGQDKLIDGLGSGGFTRPRTLKPKANEPAVQLYNLQDDPAETRNLAADKPEVVKSLQAELKRLQTAGRSRP